MERKLSGKVLIIDDEAVLRQTLTRILQTAGCETTAVVDGYQALSLLSENAFDLVYLDIHLPELDGLQILKEIRLRDARLPVILLTGHGSLQTAVEAIRLGATDYLLKPFDPEILVARTLAILQEQFNERRKRELREQIAALQAELRILEGDNFEVGTSDLTHVSQERFLKRGNLILDLQARRATLDEVVLNLPPSTFNYLLILAQRSPEVVDYQTLVSEAQQYSVEPGEARELAKWHIHTIRQALSSGEGPISCHILNVRGSGYRLLVD